MKCVSWIPSVHKLMFYTKFNFMLSQKLFDYFLYFCAYFMYFKMRNSFKSMNSRYFIYYFFINLFPQCQINVWIHFYIIFQLQFVFTFLSCFWLYERHVFLSHMASFYFLEFFWLNAVIVIPVICLWFSRYICCLTYPW